METIVTINGCFHGCYTYLLMDVISIMIYQQPSMGIFHGIDRVRLVEVWLWLNSRVYGGDTLW